MNGSIYVIKNDLNDKMYVGQTVVSVDRRFKRHLSANPHTHNQAILWAMQKYGKEHFWVETLETGITTAEELDAREEYYIRGMGTLRPGGYNLCPGGRQWRNSKLANVEPDARLVDAYLSGLSLRDVAAKFGCSVSKVKYHVVKSGHALRANNSACSKHASALTEDILRRLYTIERKTDTEIAALYGMSPRWVRKRRQTFNIRRI